mgnify:CR=1 FL=1
MHGMEDRTGDDQGLGPYRQRRVNLRLAASMATEGWLGRLLGGDERAVADGGEVDPEQ